MAFSFSCAQQQTIIDMRTSIEAGLSYNGQNLKWGDIYDYMADIGEGQSGVDASSITWLKGAAKINRGEGAASQFIRDYTNAQSVIRFGEEATINQAEMQEISDAIAHDVIQSALDLDTIPDIATIGSQDANNVAAGFFNGDKAAWSGNVLFLALGYDIAFSTNLIFDEYPDTYDLVAAIAASTTAAGEGTFEGAVSNLVQGIWTTLTTNDATTTSALAALTANSLLETVYGDDTGSFGVSTSNIVLDQIGNFGNVIDEVTTDNDFIHSASGDDTIIGSAGTDTLDGGAGIDQVDYSSLPSDSGALIQVFDDRVGSTEILTNSQILVNVEEVITTGSGNDTIVLAENTSDTEITINGGDKVYSYGENINITADGGGSVYVLEGSANVTFIDPNSSYNVTVNSNATVNISGEANSANLAIGDAPVITVGEGFGVPEKQFWNTHIYNEVNISEVAEIGTFVRYDEEATELRSQFNPVNYLGSGFRVELVDGPLGYDLSNYSTTLSNPAPIALDFYHGDHRVISIADYVYDNGASAYGFVLNPGLSIYKEDEPLTIVSESANPHPVFASSPRLLGMFGEDTGIISGTLGDDDLTGSDEADNITGDTGSGSGFSTADDGNDTITGNGGADTLTGGDGEDAFNYNQSSDSTNSNPDEITDFDAALDTINVASMGVSGLYTGSGLAPSGTLRATYSATDNATIIRSDTTDFEIRLSGGNITSDITEANFIFWDENYDDGSIRGTNEDDTLDGTDFNDTIRGLDGDDSIRSGNDGDDLLYGNQGNDTIQVWRGNDTAYGGAGNDQISLYIGNDVAFGGSGNDTISGSFGRDTLTGGDGNDVIFGESDSDVIIGGLGADTLDGGWENDALRIVQGLEEKDIFGRDVFTYTSRLESIRSGGEGKDFITDFVVDVDMIDLSALGITTFLSSGLADELYEIRVSTGNGNTYIKSDYEDANGLRFEIVLEGIHELTEDNFNLATNTTGQTINGTSGNDELTGGNGSDTLTGGLGRDTLTGGSAADVFAYNSHLESVKSGGSGKDTITDFAAGTDRIDLSALGITTLLSSGLATNAYEIRTATGNGKTYIKSDYEDANGLRFEVVLDGIYDLEATDFILATDSGSNDDGQTINGTSAGDSLTGGDGDDTITGGLGADTITSGTGADRIIYTSTSDSQKNGSGKDVIRDFDASEDIIDLSALGITTRLTSGSANNSNEIRIGQSSTATYIKNDVDLGGGAIFEIKLDGLHTLTNANFEFAQAGSNNQVINGTSNNDTLIGGDGDDSITGGIGTDRITTGDGADRIIYTSTDDSQKNGLGKDIIEDFDAANDKIDLSALGITTRLESGAADDAYEIRINGGTNTYIKSDVDLGGGTTFEIRINGAHTLDDDNFIFANDNGANIITGTNAADTLYGGSDSDIIDGQNGDDDLYGGAGNDTLIGGKGGDYLQGDAGNDVLQYNAISDSSYTDGVDYIGGFTRGSDVIDLSAISSINNVSDFSIYNDGVYTEYYSGDFAIGFNGDYTLSNSDFIFG